MDPRMLFLLPGLVAGGCKGRDRVRSLPHQGVPVYEWPEHRETPEEQHAPHEDPSPTYRGMVYLGTNISNTAARTIGVDPGASAPSAHFPGLMWPENNLVIVSSVDDLQTSERLKPTTCAGASGMVLSPNASKHLSNPSTTRVRESIARRRG
jgi:hypothetical protein